MGSNTFRLVVFRFRPGGAFQLTEEVREGVRLSSGQVDGRLAEAALGRAARASALYAAFCEASGISEVDALATSAIRDASEPEFVLQTVSAGGRIPVRVLSAEEEARYGYLGAINSTTLSDGVIVDLGGGSLQLGAVTDRLLTGAKSWPLGAVRTTEHFLAADASPTARAALRAHVRATIGPTDWLPSGRLVGMGGSVRTLATMAQRAESYPLDEIHGYHLSRDQIGALIEQMAALPANERQRIAGLKADRADITLAAAIVLDTAMEQLGMGTLEVCAQGLRWGAFYERYLGAREPRFPDVRAASVLNVARIYRYDRVHAEHVAELALQIFDGLAHLGLHSGDPLEREWLWAASILHDVGVIVDYNDHHRHGEYLVMNAGLPGFRHREIAIIGLLVRSHRKALPTIGWRAPLMESGDDTLLLRLAVCLRIAEQLERGRSQRIRQVQLTAVGDAVHLKLGSNGDASVARWAASNETGAFLQAFGRTLTLLPGP